MSAPRSCGLIPSGPELRQFLEELGQPHEALGQAQRLLARHALHDIAASGLILELEIREMRAARSVDAKALLAFGHRPWARVGMAGGHARTIAPANWRGESTALPHSHPRPIAV